jgi:hypothetical protein
MMRILLSFAIAVTILPSWAAGPVTFKQVLGVVEREVREGKLFRPMIEIAGNLQIQIPGVWMVGESAAGYLLAVRRHLETGAPLPQKIADFLPPGSTFHFYLATEDRQRADTYSATFMNYYQGVFFGYQRQGKYELPLFTTVDDVAINLMPTPGQMLVSDVSSLLGRPRSRGFFASEITEGRIHSLNNNPDANAVYRASHLFNQSVRLGLAPGRGASIPFLRQSFSDRVLLGIGMEQWGTLEEVGQNSVIYAQDPTKAWALAQEVGYDHFLQTIRQRISNYPPYPQWEENRWHSFTLWWPKRLAARSPILSAEAAKWGSVLFPLKAAGIIARELQMSIDAITHQIPHPSVYDDHCHLALLPGGTSSLGIP